MSPKEQARFWLLITERHDNEHYREVMEQFGKLHESLLGLMGQSWKDFISISNDLSRKLKKHRKPKKNAERDVEIMRLKGEGKTAGEIVRALRDQFALTDKQVNAVISRERRRPKDED